MWLLACFAAGFAVGAAAVVTLGAVLAAGGRWE